MKIIPLHERVLIQPLKEEVRRGGIILPDTVTKERPEQGKVIAVGEGKKVKKGDTVLFPKYGTNIVKVDDKEYLIVKEEDILAIVE